MMRLWHPSLAARVPMLPGNRSCASRLHKITAEFPCRSSFGGPVSDRSASRPVRSGPAFRTTVDNRPMRIRFTQMQGAGNDFVVLDETRGELGLGAAQYRFLADRHFGVGADQILSVRPAPAEGVDFQYVIHNADGGEVEQCGNGARCFMRFVREQGLTAKDQVRVQTLSGVIEPRMGADGRVTVDMGAPIFEPPRIPFDTAGRDPQHDNGWHTWHLALGTHAGSAKVSVAVLSMGNPHAVQVVPDVDT